MRVLIIEDNQKLADSVKVGLEKENISVDLAYTGVQGEEKAYITDYDVILLDLNLPDKDGLEILEFLRSEGIQTPVIIGSARDEISDRALGLNIGADDYLVKPYDLIELIARLRAVVRRFQGRSNPTIIIRDLEINPIRHELLLKGKKVKLKPKEFDILQFIAEKHPAVVSLEEIAEHVYDENFDPFSSVLRVHLARLKKQLKESGGEEVLLTIRSKGYRLWE
ncbi:response regulator transcription factor [Enterococcus sp. HY326]|uniref:response regulator transcription factor n=1 Tax=Enterococcus sp. HY326 TaxID=2971265 RepID=UPI0022400543|nr:response regulator transcription factor [Enterococcus sp. HY326]